MTQNEFQILFAVILDWIIGDPRNMFHPIRVMGRLAAILEDLTRRYLSSERLAGILTVLILLVSVFLVTTFVIDLFAGITSFLGFIVATLIIYTGIATRDLYNHAMDVFRALENNDLTEARLRVGMICGRDTQDMDSEAITRATIESVAENLVDGVTCPLFYAFIGGPVAIMLYKAVSTMDSMFGYRNERYIHFGWAAARLDDLTAFIPSRLTALLVPVAAFILRANAYDSYRIFLRDRSKHPSPNSGQSESAFAGALGIQLGGSSSYGGVVHHKEFIGDPKQKLSPGHILMALRLMTTTMLLFCSAMLIMLRLF
ncbi:MAG: adenosylcobinamide-phosphate synthase CbiB [Syntrophaceae bacterium]|nr:adenosylcobinamide-phosphate synthase CbiB [Syntrophaceae bacterium]